MEIVEVKENRKDYLPLLLLADEQESMIDRYICRGDMYVLKDGAAVKALCLVTDEGGGALEIKNLAVSRDCQLQGLGRLMLDFVSAAYSGAYSRLLVGTGDSPLTLPFYEACGFRVSHRLENFFTDNYDHPIFEAGKQLADMIYLVKDI